MEEFKIEREARAATYFLWLVLVPFFLFVPYGKAKQPCSHSPPSGGKEEREGEATLFPFLRNRERESEANPFMVWNRGKKSIPIRKSIRIRKQKGSNKEKHTSQETKGVK